jgi:hypothetical protein
MKIRKLKKLFWHSGGLGYQFRTPRLFRKVKPPEGFMWIKGTSKLILRGKKSYHE